MNHGNHHIWLSILLTSVLIAARQLPPEIMADRHMVRLNRLISENRHREAYRLTGEIAEFYEKHSLELPHEFYFKQARIVSSLGLLKEAITALHTYLNKAGKEGARYLDALDLLDRTEEELREAEAERKRIEAERRRAEAIRKQHADLVILTPRSPTGWAATRGRSAWLDGFDGASAARFLPAKTQKPEQSYSGRSTTSPYGPMQPHGFRTGWGRNK